MSEQPLPRLYKVLLVIIILLGIGTRVARLGDKILWMDEGINWSLTSSSFAEVRHYFNYEQHSYVPQLIDNLWVKIFGDSITALHSESLLWSVLSLLLFSITVLKFFDWKSAFAAVTFMSFSALLPEFAQMFRYPSLSGFLAVTWFYALMNYVNSGTRRYALIYLLSVSLFLHSHLYMVFTIFSLSLFTLLFHKMFKGRAGTLMFCNILAFLTIAPKIISLLGGGAASSKAPTVPIGKALEHIMTFPVGGIIEVFYSLFAGRYIDIRELPVTVSCLLISGLLVVLAASFWSKSRRFEVLLSAFLLAGTISIAWLAMIFRSAPFAIQYFVSVSVFFFLLLGIGAGNIWRWKPFAGVVLLIIFTSISMWFLGVYWRTLDRPANQKTTIEHVMNNSLPGDCVVISPPYSFTFDYYWNGTIPSHTFYGDFDINNVPHNNIFFSESDRNQVDENKMERWDRFNSGNCERVWIYWVLGTINTEDRSGFAEKWLDTHYERLETTPFRMFPYSNNYTGVLVLYKVKAESGS